MGSGLGYNVLINKKEHRNFPMLFFYPFTSPKYSSSISIILALPLPLGCQGQYLGFIEQYLSETTISLVIP